MSATPPLTDAELSEMTRARSANDRVSRLVAEVRAARALLATPLECGWPEPKVDRGVVPPLVMWNPLGDGDINAITFEPDESVAIGAAFMRAGLAALDSKGNK